MTVFVGRGSELDRLDRRLDAVLAGDGGTVFVTGDAGAGKSALLERFLVSAALREPNALIVAAECSEQYGAGEPYQPFVEAFRDLVRVDRSTGRVRLPGLARELAPYWLSVIPVAGDLIAATMATAAELKGTFGERTATAVLPSEEALYFQYTELLLAAAAETPVILAIDDLHWADRASVSLLVHVARKIADKPILIIGTYRPADAEVSGHPIKDAKLELEGHSAAEALRLEPLESAALAEFVREELGAPPTPELLRWLESRAGSNPLFFGELLKWMVEREIAERHYDEWRLGHVPREIEMPRTAESVIEKRLSRLEPELYRVLEYASIEGNEFNTTTLARLLDTDELQLEEMIEPLVRVHRLVRLEEEFQLPGGDISSVYEFRHSLFQHVLHKGLVGKRRVLLHRKMAEILEDTYADDTAVVAHKLALHYDEGRRPAQAYGFALQAAELASGVHAHHDALDLLRRALRNSDEEKQKIEVLDRLGEESRLVGHFADALEQFEEALAGAESHADRTRALTLKRKIVRVERDYGDWSPQELFDRLTRLADEARELDARSELCEILWYFRDVPETPGAEDAAREALEISEELGELRGVARAQFELGIALMFGDEPGGAIAHLRQALRLYRELPDKNKVALCHNALGIVHTMLGKYQSAATELEAAAKAFDELVDPVNEASARNNLGALLTRTGDWQRAESNLLEALRLTQRMDASARVLHPLQNLAELYQAKGDCDTAQHRWQEYLSLAEAIGYWNAEVIGHCGLGSQALDCGDLQRARAELEAAEELINHPEEWMESREFLELFAARLKATDGKVDEAVTMLEAAEEVLEHRDRFLWATYMLTRGELVTESDKDIGRRIVRQAMGAFEQLGAEPMRRRAEEFLSRTRG